MVIIVNLMMQCDAFNGLVNSGLGSDKHFFGFAQLARFFFYIYYMFNFLLYLCSSLYFIFVNVS